MSKKILRQSEANVTENRDKPTQTHYCGFVFVLTLHVCMMLCSSGLARFYLQDILTSQNVRSERTRSENFSLKMMITCIY